MVMNDTAAKKRSLSGPAILSIFLLSILVIAAVILIAMKIQYNAKWGNFDPYGANASAGENVVAYNVGTEKFTTKCIPFEMWANSKDDVGYVLIVEQGETTGAGGFYGTSGKLVTGQLDTVKVTLRNYKTGQVIKTDTIKAKKPSAVGSASSSFHAKVHDSQIQEWVKYQHQRGVF